MNNSYNEFEDMLNELSNKKIGELSIREISKYLLLAEELDWVDTNVGDDKIFYDYNKNLLENLSYILEDSIFRLINEEILYNYDLHTKPMDLENN
jgi:hypothetical protein